MKEAIMLFSSVLFGILFFFLLFIFSIFIVSRFIKRKYPNFEPNVSVVVPAYNEQANIKECIDSIYSLDYPKNKIEVIVVDDGSTDKTLEIATKYRKVRILTQNHLGKVEALNLGCAKAKYGFVLTIDADTAIDRKLLREMIAPFSSPNVGATSGNNVVKNKESIISAFQNVEYHFSNLIRNSFSTVFNNGIWFSGSLACYRKSSLKKIKYFKKKTIAQKPNFSPLL